MTIYALEDGPRRRTALQESHRIAPRHMPWLDWLRFGAAGTVLFDHARQIAFVDYGSLDPASRGPAAALLMFVGRAGYEAVIIFFVISGFLVGGVAIERALNGTFMWKTYTADRVARIATPLIPAICLAAALCYLTGGSVDWVEATGNMLSLQGIFVAPFKADLAVWSLSYEVWFYILGGASAACLMRFRWQAAFLAAVALLVYIKLDAKFLLIWLIGGSAYFYRPRRGVTFQTCAAVGVSMTCLLLSQLTRESHVLNSIVFINNDMSIIALAFGIAWLLSCLREMGSAKIVAQAGAYAAAPSYTLYLTHQPILGVASYLGVKPGQLTIFGTLIFIFLLVVASIWAVFIYWIFERNTPVAKRMLERIMRVERGDQLH